MSKIDGVYENPFSDLNYSEHHRTMLFWGGVFSQWYRSEIIIDGVSYNCNEQYMMAQKAVVFQDHKSHEAIMGTDDPYKQKMVGRAVKGFTDDVWELYAFDVVYKANYAKFTQNTKNKKYLMDTGLYSLVEASPSDKVWGIGMGQDNPMAFNRHYWLGTNLLGVAIDKVKENLYYDILDNFALVIYN